MKPIQLIITLASLITLGACAAKPVVVTEKVLPKNSEILIGEFGYWKRDCSNRHFDIYIEEYPKEGDIRFEVGSLIITDKAIAGSPNGCVGQSIKSKKVIYIPDPDFVGDDTVSYVVKSSKLLGDRAYDVNINVE